MKTALLLAAVALFVFVGAAARADYYNPPAWDHSDPTFTHQGWQFSTGANPAAPEDLDNPFGTPTFSINGATWFASAAPYIPGSTRTGLWAGSYSGSATISLNIPNNEDPARYKLVWLQATIGCTYINGLNVSVDLTPCGNQTVTALYESLYAMPSGEQYGYYYEKLWKIDPQPGCETITAQVSYAGGLCAIDEIDVDTICVPEPGSVLGVLSGLTGLAGFAIRRRK